MECLKTCVLHFMEARVWAGWYRQKTETNVLHNSVKQWQATKCRKFTSLCTTKVSLVQASVHLIQKSSDKVKTSLLTWLKLQCLPTAFTKHWEDARECRFFLERKSLLLLYKLFVSLEIQVFVSQSAKSTTHKSPVVMIKSEFAKWLKKYLSDFHNFNKAFLSKFYVSKQNKCLIRTNKQG